jgi:hypothetical protein
VARPDWRGIDVVDAAVSERRKHRCVEPTSRPSHDSTCNDYGTRVRDSLEVTASGNSFFARSRGSASFEFLRMRSCASMALAILTRRVPRVQARDDGATQRPASNDETRPPAGGRCASCDV